MTKKRESGLKAAETNTDKHGPDFYSRIAAKTTEAWKKNGRKPRGFAAMTIEQRRAAQLKATAARMRKKRETGN